MNWHEDLSGARKMGMRTASSSGLHSTYLKLDAAVHKRIEALARADHRTVAQLLRKIIYDFVKQADSANKAPSPR